MINNSFAKANEERMTFEYESNGNKVKLSPATVRNYLVSGGGAVTDQEVMMFLTLCKYQKLNPFLREAYLIKFGNSPATIVTGKDVFTKRAMKNPLYAGKTAGIIVQDETGSVIEREGTFKLPEEKIVGGWAKVYIKGYENPEYVSVSFDEYVGKKKDGTVNDVWGKKPATMIRKVAVVQALKEAFPEDFSGLNAPEEVPEATSVTLPEFAVDMDQQQVVETQTPTMIDEKAQTRMDASYEQDIAGALFG